ncbi:apolipoprotein N-acyltransferase [bacterium]|nr:apolipoprotein N-acyltransferase [bacterium]
MLLNAANALLAGVLLALAFPLSLPAVRFPGVLAPIPLELLGANLSEGYIHLPWLAFVALLPLLVAVRHSSRPGEAFCYGYLCGVLWLLLHWLWLGSFGWVPVVLTALMYALPVGLFALLAHWLILQRRAGLITWGVAALWVGIEYLRSFGFWAFPWNFLGHTQAQNLPLIQVADLGGAYAVSFLVALVNAAIFTFITAAGGIRRSLGHAALAGAVLLFAYAYGEYRLATLPCPPSGAHLQVALVQGGAGSRQGWSDQVLTEALAAYVPVTDDVMQSWEEGRAAEHEMRAGFVGPVLEPELLVVWPESALPKALDQRRPALMPIQVSSLFEGRDNVALLMGALGQPSSDDKRENGSLLLEERGAMRWAYSKLRLVPYGEVVPFRNLVRFFDYPWGRRDLSEGRSLAPFTWRGHSLGLMICFDNVFTFVPRGQVRRGAGALILMTNNSWYDLQSGARQHSDIDVFRAVEYRRPMARVSTTGISHVISPEGRVVHETAMDKEGLIRTSLAPGKVVTPYLILGDLFAQLCLALGMMITIPAMLIGRSEGML